MKAIIKWIATDGLLHILVCYALMLTFTPLIGSRWATLLTAVIAASKEIYDILKKRNNFEQSLHDVICDLVGIFLADLIILVHALTETLYS